MNRMLKIIFIVYAGFFLLLFFLAIISWVPPFNYSINTIGKFRPWLPISSAHWLGTNNTGNDTFTLIVYGAKTVFLSGIAALIPFLIFGVVLGLLSGYGSGKAAFAADKIIDVFNMIPKILLLLILISFMPINTYRILAIFGIIVSPKLAELIKRKVLTLKAEEFFESAISLGATRRTILLKHVLWYNGKDLLMSQAVYIFNLGIMMEASLSYIGLGFSGKTVSWGSMIYNALISYNMLQIIAPSAALTLTTYLLYIMSNMLYKKLAL